MRFASASQLAPGKQNRSRFGLRGSTEAPKSSPFDSVGFLALWSVMQATDGDLAEPPIPKAAQVPLLYAFRCFPPASPIPASWAGKQKTAPMDRSKSLISLRKSGAGEGIRTLDPNLGKVVLYP